MALDARALYEILTRPDPAITIAHATVSTAAPAPHTPAFASIFAIDQRTPSGVTEMNRSGAPISAAVPPTCTLL